MADIRAQARATAIAPGSGGAGEQAALERLGRLTLAFLDAVEGDSSGAVATYEALAGPLERSYDAHRAALDRLSQSVIDADGDMDAMIASPTWHQHQALAAQALYYLNWLHYQGGLLFGGAKRTSLLEKAARGFGEFATADSTNPIVAESHLGRGLAYLELDKVDWAIADFQAAVEAKGASAEKQRKARLALADAYVKAGRASEALRASEQALAAASPAERPRAQLTRVRALLMAAAARPGERTAYQGEARRLLAELRAGGGAAARYAAAIERAGLANPQVWAGARAKAGPPPPSEWEVTRGLVAEGKYTQAIPRLARVLASRDEEDRGHASEARYLLGVAQYRSGDVAQAIATLGEVLADAGARKYHRDAAYLRFKGEEARYAADPSAAQLPAYQQAITVFLRAYPQDKAAAEARFRLGEIAQRAGRHAEAIAEYDQVHGDPAFELRARFASAQSAVKRLEELEEEGAALDPALRAEAETALGRYWTWLDAHDTSTLAGVPVEEFTGRAALMSAYLAALAEPPDWEQALTRLAEFDERYPMLAEERPRVVKLRLTALTRLGRLTEAAVEAKRPTVAELDVAFLDDVANRLLTTTARAQGRGEVAAARAGKRAALRLLEHVVAAEEAGDAATPPAVARRRRATLAALYEQVGRRERALALYRQILSATPESLSARAGAARILETEGRSDEARALWDALAAAPPGRGGWLEAHYQSARLSVALGEPARACAVLREVPQDVLLRSNSETPRRIQGLLREHCAG